MVGAVSLFFVLLLMVQLGVSVSDRLATGLDAAQRLEQKKETSTRKRTLSKIDTLTNSRQGKCKKKRDPNLFVSLFF